MTKSEILQVAKPILFNTEMVKAILDGRKTMTRQVIKPQPQGHFEVSENPIYIYDTDFSQGKIMPPYQTGDILYVREAFAQPATHIFWYKATPPKGCENLLWKPSIHMPKEAARIFLRVTKVHCERLQEIDGQEVLKEGVNTLVHPEADYFNTNQREAFERLWNSTIKKKDLEKYGWDASPWVWVIEFEKVEVDG